MKMLGWWLMLVGSLRLASVWFGFFNIWALRLAVFSNTTRDSNVYKLNCNGIQNKMLCLDGENENEVSELTVTTVGID
ncbi:hypothetical protein RHGRI_021691 [Rhododendron griersonianum]|uniref:Secreted protein n=1 Tax=Rhododendron griersonianum TaxID=479676 RepID=A0AAV6JLF7_9ERIC|nr:hypothetical protein RHGRI_021691 [Rhododendron griersonianum]